MKNELVFQTSLGNIRITEENEKITGVSFADGITSDSDIIKENDVLLNRARLQIEEYICKERKEFDLPIELSGTEFQKRIYMVLQKIPYGERWSYKRVAEESGAQKAARAVGQAVNRNPLLILIPCHRVVGTDGKMVGFAGGIDKKIHLLEIERGSNS